MNNNSLHNRKIFQKSTDISYYCRSTFGEKFEIRYCNFGFVVIPIVGQFVYKYYLWWLTDIYSYANREAKNYLYFHQNSILVPTYEILWDISIWGQLFTQAKIHNIRTCNKRFESFQDFDIQQLASILTRIHSIRPGSIHGNIHPSNFFVDMHWNIGIFDLITYGPGLREKDISRIFINSWYDEDFLGRFLVFYKLDISLKKVYLITLIELRELMNTWFATGFEDMMKKVITLIHS